MRQRPVWLERLMTAAQQQLFTQTETQQHVETVGLDNNGMVDTPAAAPEPDNNIPQGPILKSNNTQQSTCSSVLFDPESVSYDSDSLPSLDLSQLTLDSELIFPS